MEKYKIIGNNYETEVSANDISVLHDTGQTIFRTCDGIVAVVPKEYYIEKISNGTG